MANKITNIEHYAAIADAIRRKNGETDTYTPAEMADAIGRIPKGGGGASENDVNFYDYDGSIVASYTAAQFAALEEMPENPDHTDDGLTSQGWNWSLANAKAYVAKYGKLNVGQMYVPTDGKTHVFINIPDDDQSYKATINLGHTTVSGQTVIDWGDGNTDTVSGISVSERTHTYARPGKHEITLDTVNGYMSLSFTNTNRTGTHFSGAGDLARNLTRIEKIYLSTNVDINTGALSHCYALQSVTIPEGVTNIGNYAFYFCYALQSVTIPEGVTSIGSYAFYYCCALQSVTIPEGVTSIGAYEFRNCYALQSVTIPDSATSIGDNAFYYCYVLRSVTIPDSVTSIGTSTFYYCYALQSVTIPEGVTSIGNNAFNSCYALQSVTIPDSVTSIGISAFSYNYAILSYHIRSMAPPTLSNTNAFNGISTDTVFYVPASSLEAYKTANNWSTYASRMVAEPE